MRTSLLRHFDLSSSLERLNGGSLTLPRQRFGATANASDCRPLALQRAMQPKKTANDGSGCFGLEFAPLAGPRFRLESGNYSRECIAPGLSLTPQRRQTRTNPYLWYFRLKAYTPIVRCCFYYIFLMFEAVSEVDAPPHQVDGSRFRLKSCADLPKENLTADR